MRFSKLPILACAPLALVQAGLFGTTPLQDLQSAVERMDSTIASWGGGLVGLIPIAFQAETLETQIRQTQTSLEKLGARSTETDQSILRDGQAALDSLGHAMATVADSAGKFRNVPMGVPIMYGILKSFEISTNKMIQAGVDGSSPSAKPQLEAIQGQAKEYYENALRSFEMQFS